MKRARSWALLIRIMAAQPPGGPRWIAPSVAEDLVRLLGGGSRMVAHFERSSIDEEWSPRCYTGMMSLSTVSR